jgi:hypothetical protein
LLWVSAVVVRFGAGIFLSSGTTEPKRAICLRMCMCGSVVAVVAQEYFFTIGTLAVPGVI